MNRSNIIQKLRDSIGLKLIVSVGLVLLISISTWAYFNIDYQKKKVMGNIIASTDRLTTTIRLGAHYAMMHNSRDEINQIILNIARQKKIENIRIYNKAGEIKFSNRAAEVDSTTNIEAEACYICHRTDPPLTTVPLHERLRFFRCVQGYRLLGIISPIKNESGCATGACHFHPEDKKILGALDVVVSLEDTDKEILMAEKSILKLAIFVFLVTSAIIFVFVLKFVNRPIKKLIEGTGRIAKGEYTAELEVDQTDEVGRLAKAIHAMGKEIGQQQDELNKQRDEYQNLFERVPCLITVQDKNYRLIRYNREFADMFDPKPGDYCFHAYKGRDSKCRICPVEETFKDGLPHYSEESGVNKDGTKRYWIVKTSPIRNSSGEIVAAMETNLDITDRKKLEVELKKSQKKYHAIFNNIPNPVFVLDKDTLDILDCNKSVEAVYGLTVYDLIARPFLDLFLEEDKEIFRSKIKESTVLNQVKHVGKSKSVLFVNIRISPSEYLGRKVLLVTTSDITKRLEAEQQLIQASRMATMGEMATGVAHELNQPLSVVKTVTSFLLKKIDQREKIDPEILQKMLSKADANMDRATKIINHMRQFARKSDLELEKVFVNGIIESAFEIFSQQLKVRGIDVVWEVDKNLPKIHADPGRLEQVYINLLLNARDAIEEKWSQYPQCKNDGKITIKTYMEAGQVVSQICDTGIGIPEGLANKIFEPFFTTKEVGKGTGLGLSISYGIVKDCNASIEARSSDRETCFTIKFPIKVSHE